MGITGRFTDHPASVGETYGEHFRMATHFASQMAKATFACAVHAVYPHAFQTTGSDTIRALYDEMNSGKRGELAELRAAEAEQAAAGSVG